MPELSGSPKVNPRAGKVSVKNRAKYHKVVKTSRVRDIIGRSVEDLAQPKPTEFN